MLEASTGRWFDDSDVMTIGLVGRLPLLRVWLARLALYLGCSFFTLYFGGSAMRLQLGYIGRWRLAFRPAVGYTRKTATFNAFCCLYPAKDSRSRRGRITAKGRGTKTMDMRIGAFHCDDVLAVKPFELSIVA